MYLYLEKFIYSWSGQEDPVCGQRLRVEMVLVRSREESCWRTTIHWRARRRRLNLWSWSFILKEWPLQGGRKHFTAELAATDI